jgi:hypothetical protein
MSTAGQQIIDRVLTYDTAAVSGATGTMSAFFGNSPGSSPDWSAAQALYQEFRVLAMEVTYTPNFATYSTASTPLLGGQLVLFEFRNVALTLPTTYAGAIQFQPYRLKSVTQPDQLTVRLRDDAVVNPQGWQNVTSPAQTFGVGYFATGLDASKTYGLWTVRFRCQFKAPN